MTNSCENHAEREGLLTVSLPSFGIMRYMCGECRTAFDNAMAEHARNAPRGRQEWWIENEPFWGWNNEYQISYNDRPEHTIDRSKE